MKFLTVRIHVFLVTLTVCCHPESLLPWEPDVMTSPLLSIDGCGIKDYWGVINLRASSLGRSGSGVRKGRRACNYICGI